MPRSMRAKVVEGSSGIGDLLPAVNSGLNQ